jgi:hypothetical protein
MRKEFDLTGKRFGKLTVIKYEGSNGQGRKWLCQCDCGREKVIFGKNLKRGVKSCGCARGPSRNNYKPTGDEFFVDNGVMALRAAILNQAAIDYRQGSKKEKTWLEKWFLSDWGQFISGDMGEVIVERLRKGE